MTPFVMICLAGIVSPPAWVKVCPFSSWLIKIRSSFLSIIRGYHLDVACLDINFIDITIGIIEMLHHLMRRNVDETSEDGAGVLEVDQVGCLLDHILEDLPDIKPGLVLCNLKTIDME